MSVNKNRNNNLQPWSWVLACSLLALVAMGCGTMTAGSDGEPSVSKQRTSLLVQAASMEQAAEAVLEVGGEITHELGIIHGVSAMLTASQVSLLGEMDGVRIHENRAVSTASVCTVEGELDLRPDKNKILWDLTNSGGVPVTIDRIEVSWPDANEKL